MRQIFQHVMYLIILAISLLFFSKPAVGCELELNSAQRSAADKKRDESSQPCAMFDLVPLQKGAVVLDLLGGAGYFSELLAQQVGNGGKVYLHNNQAYLPYVETQLQARLADNRLSNVIRYDRELSDLTLEKSSLDAVFFVMGYHDMYHVSEGWRIDAKQLMQQVFQAMKPGALMLVVDHNAPVGTGIATAQELHRIEASYVQQELQQFGFKLITTSTVLHNPQDDYSKSVFDAAVRGNTDRFVVVVQKPLE